MRAGYRGRFILDFSPFYTCKGVRLPECCWIINHLTHSDNGLHIIMRRKGACDISEGEKRLYCTYPMRIIGFTKMISL